MTLEVNYTALKTVKIEVDDNYKTMLNNDKAWNTLIGSLSETVLKKVREIEDDYYINQNDILGVSDVETDEVIYEN